MKIGDLCRSLDNAEIWVPGDIDRDITFVVAGDLLSFIMGTASEGSVWVTIQAHLNVAAVAVLKDLPMIIIAAGRAAPQDLIERCRKENICIVSAKETLYGVCRRLSDLGLGE